jgi:hypothetical protein
LNCCRKKIGSNKKRGGMKIGGVIDIRVGVELLAHVYLLAAPAE